MPPRRSRSPTRRRCRSPSSATCPTATGTRWASSSSGRPRAGAPPSRSRTRCTRPTGSSPRWPTCRGYLRMPIYAAAQAVQHSADGSAYAQYAGMGAELATRVHRLASRARSGASTARPVGKARLAAAATRPDQRIRAAARRLTARDPAARVTVRDARQGWAVAGWLVSHAAEYGITYVRYRGYSGSASAGRSTGSSARPGRARGLPLPTWCSADSLRSPVSAAAR